EVLWLGRRNLTSDAAWEVRRAAKLRVGSVTSQVSADCERSLTNTRMVPKHTAVPNLALQFTFSEQALHQPWQIAKEASQHGTPNWGLIPAALRALS
ncbi:hypothetical protein Tco_1452540, partial [Tanacetum coccineum]